MKYPKSIDSKIQLLNLFEQWKKLSSLSGKIIGQQFRLNIDDYKLPIFNENDFFSIADELMKDVQNNKCMIKSALIDGETYNSQWRRFGANEDIENRVDQIDWLVKILKKKNFDRRLLLVAWNPSGNEESVLTHCLLQFYVADGILSCKLYQSSGDLEKILRFDSGRCVLFTYMLCHITGLRPGMFIHSFGDIDFNPNDNWTTEMDLVNEFPTIKLSGNITEIEDFIFKNFHLVSGKKINFESPGNWHCLCESPVGIHEEVQYLQLVRNILDNGTKLIDRTKVGTMSLFGPQMVFTLRDNTLPLLTTKRVFARGIIEELLWFLRGSTNGNELAEKNVHIWDANGSVEFLTSIGLGYRESGDLGPVYGFQWRHFGAKYETMHSDYSNLGIDQISNVIKAIKMNPQGKNHVVMAWNPKDLPLMALPPCHCLMQFFVEGDELSCKLYQRSGDMGLGVPFNIASYAILTHMVAHVTGLKAGRFFHSLGDSHVYLNHINAIAPQLTREPRAFPKLRFKRQVDRIEDFHVDDFIIEDYHPHAKIAMEMAL